MYISLNILNVNRVMRNFQKESINPEYHYNSSLLNFVIVQLVLEYY